MATAKIDSVIQHLRRVMLAQNRAGKTDGQLLASFIDQRDEAAFEGLVRRHGPMVFGVCRRIIGNHHDAEDAFQATFLVLARKASSVRPRERVANWLHGVALRTAMKAKTMTAKRREREKQVTEMPEPESVQKDQWRDLQPLLDQELNGLPENYRLPILLCDLEGQTIKDASQQLGWPQGTLASRLARGRKLLAKRLANRGVVLSAGSLTAVVSQNAASAAVPAPLLSSTVKAATMIAAGQAMVAGVVPAQVAVLTEGVTKAMLLTNLKTAVAVPLVMALAIGGGAGLVYQTQAAGQRKAQKVDETTDQWKHPAREKEKPKSDMERLQGAWQIVSMVGDGKKEEGIANWTIKGTTLRIMSQPKDDVELKTFIRFRLNETTNPKRIDLVGGKADDLFDTTLFDKRLDDADKRKEGIYSIAGDTLKICVCRKKGDRPARFESKEGSNYALILLKRANLHDEQKKAGLEKESEAESSTSAKSVRFTKQKRSPQEYKGIFKRMLAVMAEHFEHITYANQYDGQIKARTVDAKRSGIIREATVSLLPQDDGGLSIAVTVNKVKVAGDKSEVVGRDTDLEQAILGMDAQQDQKDKASATKPAGAKLKREYKVFDLLDQDDTTAQPLMRLITKTILPRSWSENGGDCVIEYIPEKGILIIQHTEEIHKQVKDLLDGLRRRSARKPPLPEIKP